MSRLALFADLDDTFFGTTKIQQKATQRIISLLDQKNIALFAVTGRRLDMITDPSPFTGLACEVGTRIYYKNRVGHFALDTTYQRYVKKISDFQHAIIHRLSKKLLRDIQNQFPKIHFQFQPLQQKFKISFTFTSSVTQGLQIQHIFQKHFTTAGYSKIQVILSAAKSAKTKKIDYNLDVLAVGKETAVAYLAKKYHYQPIVAGDGGNDINMLLHSSWPAIIVGGYKPEVQRALQVYLKRPLRKQIYIEPLPKQSGPMSLLRGLHTLLPKLQHHAH